MQLCKRCVFRERDCSPETIFIAEGGECCYEFRPFKVNCSRCGEEIVHGARRTLICLDCLIELLDEEGAIFLMAKDKVKHFELYN